MNQMTALRTQPFEFFPPSEIFPTAISQMQEPIGLLQMLSFCPYIYSKIVEGSLDSIPSPSLSMKIQIMLTSPSNVLACYLK